MTLDEFYSVLTFFDFDYRTNSPYVLYAKKGITTTKGKMAYSIYNHVSKKTDIALFQKEISSSLCLDIDVHENKELFFKDKELAIQKFNKVFFEFLEKSYELFEKNPSFIEISNTYSGFHVFYKFDKILNKSFISKIKKYLNCEICTPTKALRILSSNYKSIDPITLEESFNIDTEPISYYKTIENLDAKICDELLYTDSPKLFLNRIKESQNFPSFIKENFKIIEGNRCEKIKSIAICALKSGQTFETFKEAVLSVVESSKDYSKWSNEKINLDLQSFWKSLSKCQFASKPIENKIFYSNIHLLQNKHKKLLNYLIKILGSKYKILLYEMIGKILYDQQNLKILNPNARFKKDTKFLIKTSTAFSNEWFKYLKEYYKIRINKTHLRFVINYLKSLHILIQTTNYVVGYYSKHYRLNNIYLKFTSQFNYLKKIFYYVATLSRSRCLLSVTNVNTKDPVFGFT